ncbi:MAG: dihydrodipicolinate synthase family protein [Paracoccaceae bacterium]
MKTLKGILAAMCTPMDKHGEAIDMGVYRAHIDEMIDAGLHGTVLGSGTGEYAYLTQNEKRKLISEGARHVGKRITTVAQVTELSTQEVIDGALFAQDVGVDAIMIMPPYLEPPNERGVMYHYTAVAKAVSIPIVMYNVPAQAAPLTEDLYRKLIAVENLDYVKDSSGDIAGIQKLIAIGGKVLNGADPYAPYSLMAGSVGMIWGAANFMPNECVKLYNLIDQGKLNEAMELWDCMKAICLWLWSNRHDVDYLTGVKAATRLTGRDMGGARKPLPPVPSAARHDIRLALSKLPVNRTKADRLVWRDWQEERDWLIQSTKNN